MPAGDWQESKNSLDYARRVCLRNKLSKHFLGAWFDISLPEIRTECFKTNVLSGFKFRLRYLQTLLFCLKLHSKYLGGFIYYVCACICDGVCTRMGDGGEGYVPPTYKETGGWNQVVCCLVSVLLLWRETITTTILTKESISLELAYSYRG